MIYFVYGKPGGGKSMWCMGEMVRHLLESDVDVVTNIAVKLPDLAEYIDQLKPGNDIDVFSRVRILEIEDLSQFWRHRSGGFVLPEFEEYPKEKSTERTRRQLEYFQLLNDQPDDNRRGVVYMIDECHNIFSAHRWQECGSIVTTYATQHRHLADSVYLISQDPELTYKLFRRLVQEWHYIENFYTRSIGIFARRGRFRRSSYYSQPGPNSKPFERVSFELDVAGLAACYETRGALGVKTVGREVQRRVKRKLPWWAVPAVVCAVVACFFGFLWAVPGMISDYFGSVADAGQAAIGSGQSTAGSADRLVSRFADPRSSDRPENPVYGQPDLWVTGVARVGRRVRVSLSDGSTLDDTDDIERISPGGVWIDGRKYPMAPPYGGESPRPDSPESVGSQALPDEGHRHTAQHPDIFDRGPMDRQALDRKMNRNNVLR